MDAVRELVVEKITLLAVCYSHLLLAWAFDGEVSFHTHGWEIGIILITLSEQRLSDSLFAGRPPGAILYAGIPSTVRTASATMCRLAGNQFDRNHALRLGNSPWGVPLHLEFAAATTRSCIRSRSDQIVAKGQHSEWLSARSGKRSIRLNCFPVLQCCQRQGSRASGCILFLHHL